MTAISKQKVCIMSEISADIIKKVAHLARLNVNDDELSKYTQNISQVLELIEQINSAQVDELKPLANALDATLTARADEVTETNQREQLLKLAPATEAGLILVPKVIE